jgi:hypothetical protein
MDKAALDSELQQIASDRDDERLEKLVNSLSAAELQLYKEELTEAWLGIFEIWYYDFSCDKVKMNDWPDSFFTYLLDLLSGAEKINAPTIYYEERTWCYQEWARLKDHRHEQLLYIDKAIAEMTAALREQPDSCQFSSSMVSVLLDKIEINNQFTDEEFEQVLIYFELTLSRFSNSALPSLLSYCFIILDFPFPKNRHWHAVFFHKLNTTLYALAEESNLIYLEWSNELTRIVDNRFDNISPGYAQILTKQSINLLKPLTNFETDNPERLNQLGSAFKNAAKHLSETDQQAAALHYYEVALACFMKGQDINPAAWTFPVYATNVLTAMAVIYYQQHDHDTVIALFEKGRFIFSKNLEPEQDFTLNMYWGRFLIEYARLAYRFDAPDMLQEADEKLLIAQQLGQGYYDQPYIARAKVALKLGDGEKCLSILRECKAVLSHDYYQYSLNKVIEDEDFAAIKQAIAAIDNP